ncbi:hypothetical protein ACF073_38975 [Streptomyces sp. NPDC015171]|uniref:hypothetical protein n=1 Tax=Streptomyces sp. NPDC015171 TaxID=3364945 RepID=UPI0036FD4B4E
MTTQVPARCGGRSYEVLIGPGAHPALPGITEKHRTNAAYGASTAARFLSGSPSRARGGGVRAPVPGTRSAGRPETTATRRTPIGPARSAAVSAGGTTTEAVRQAAALRPAGAAGTEAAVT